MATVLGTLTIDLKANTATFSQSMDKMSSLSAKTANDVKRSLEKISAAGLAMGAAIVTGTAALIKSALDAGDRLDELAQSAGTSVESLSALSYAAKFSSLSAEDLSGSLVKLSKSSFAAQNGNDQLARVFKRLGVSVTDSSGHLKDSGVLFEELAPKFAGMADGAGKTAIALQLFGKSGAASIPFLNQLGESQGKLTKEARELGLVMGSSTAKAAGDVNDNFDRLKGTFNGLKNSLLAEILPALQDFTEELLKIAKSADIPALGKTFGQAVITGIKATGDAIQYAAAHTHELKLAIEALLALQVAKFTIPFLAEISAGSLTAGIGKFTLSILGIGKLFPVLAQLGNSAKYTAEFLKLLAVEEGVVAAATYALNQSFLALAANPFVLAIAGLGTLVYLSHKLAVEQGKAREVADQHAKSLEKFGGIKVAIPDSLKGVTLNPPAALPTKGQRLVNLVSDFDAAHPEAKDRKLPQPDTEGLTTPKKDIYGEEIKKLDLAIASQRAYLAVLDATPEKIAAVASAERAEAIILEKNNALIDSQRPKLTARQEATIRQKAATEDTLKALEEYGKSIVDQQHSTDLATKQQQALNAAIFEGEDATRAASVSNTILGLTYGKTAEQIEAMKGRLETLRGLLQRKSDVDSQGALAKSIDDQTRSAELAILQANNLADAQAHGEAAVRAATTTNAILGLTYEKNAEQIKALAPEIEKLRDAQIRKAAADRLDAAQHDIFDLNQDIQSRRGLAAAILDGEDAYRKAALAARLYNLEQQIGVEGDAKVREALVAKRDLITQQAKAENNEVDAREALALRSPLAKYREETAALRRQIEALTDSGKRSLTYGEALEVAAKNQEIFNRAIDEQVALLTRSGTARDGVTAFFLNMQKQAKSTAAIVYDALNSTFEKISDNLTELVTGGKTNFGQAFKDIGKQIVGDTLKQQLQKGIGAIGNKLGIDLSALKGKPDGTQSNPLWVRMGTPGALGASGAGIGDAITKAIKGKFGDKSDGFVFHLSDKGIGPNAGTNTFGKPDGTPTNPFYVVPIGGQKAAAQPAKQGFFGSLLQALGPLVGAAIGAGIGGSSSGGFSTDSSISFPDLEPRARGGLVNPRSAYLVGENGPEILRGASGRISSNLESRKILGGAGNTYYITQDNRGADEARIMDQTRRGVLAAHNSAVSTGVQATIEFQKRTPQR